MSVFCVGRPRKSGENIGKKFENANLKIRNQHLRETPFTPKLTVLTTVDHQLSSKSVFKGPLDAH